MEWYDFLKDKLNIDVLIVALVLLSGFFQKKYLCGWVWAKKDGRLDEGFKTLAVSFVVSSIYIILTVRELKRATDGEDVIIPWAKWLVSYFAATSLYDLVIRPFTNWIKRKTGDTDPTAG